MNKPLLNKARDALLASRCYVDVEGSDAELDVHQDAIAALEAELAKPEGCLSNCDTCTYAWGSPANPGHCVMFFEEPQGVCPKHSEPGQTRNCSRHPDAPHGFDRNGSHAAGRHVCTCESWAPGEAS